jgi:Domain of unknown function (DUF4114)
MKNQGEKMKRKILILGVVLALLAAMIAPLAVSAGPVTYGWQTWTIAAISGANQNNGTPYWNNLSVEGANENVGDILSGANGNTDLTSPPGAIPYWGASSGGASDPNIFFASTGSAGIAYPAGPGQVTVKVVHAGNAATNVMGWYDVANNSVLNQLFIGASAGTSVTFTPSAQFGLYFVGEGDKWYSQANLNTSGEQSDQHFAVFKDASGNFWVGSEDHAFSIADKDYNDMVVEIIPPSVPIPTPITTITGASTSITVQSGGSNPPLVKAMWESTDSQSNNESGDPNHTSFVDPLLTQVAPNPGFQAKTQVNFWAVVTDPAGVGNLGNIYADVYYPASGTTDPGANGSLKFEVQLTMIATDGLSGTALTYFNAANAAHMVEVNANTPTFSYPIGSSATQVGDIQEELIQGTANLYYGIYYFDNCELAGNYPVVVNAVNLQNVHGTLGDTLQWLPLTSAAFDFTAVNYGQVAVGVDKQINGDYIWNTSLSGANPATIENTGNTYLQMTVRQDDMGLGSTQVNGVTTWNVFYDARMGDGSLGGFGYNGIVTYNPNTTVTLPQILKLCALDKIDFSITVVKDPSTSTNHNYSGTMTLGVVYSTGPALEGTEYMIGTPAPSATP